MPSIFKDAALEKAVPIITGAEIISCHKTRLGGYIYHLLMKTKKEAFMKVGTGYERLDINRQYENISSLQGYLPIPKIYDYANNHNLAAIILEKMPGHPFHTLIPSLDRQDVLLIIKDILKTIYNLSYSIIQNLEVGISLELKDIKNLIDDKKIREDSFNSYGLSLKQAYNKIKDDLQNHNTKILSHGDLCLPNIIVTSDKKWSLVDLGKCGLGDAHRDLSSLEVSLRKNIDELAFTELCEMMNLESDTQFKNKINLYKLIDLFWYNANL